MMEALFLVFIYVAGYGLLSPADGKVPRLYRHLCAIPAGIASWPLALAIVLALGLSPVWAAIVLVLIAAASAGTVLPFWMDRRRIGFELGTVLLGCATVAVIVLLLSKLGAVQGSYDSLTQIQVGRAAVGLGFNADVLGTLGSWGFLVPSFHGAAVLLGQGYLTAFHPLVAILTLLLLVATITISSGRRLRDPWLVVPILCCALLFATTYFIVFQAIYIHNSLVSAMFLLIAVHALWEAAKTSDNSWLRYALFGLLGFSMSRTEAPIFAAIILVLAFSADGLRFSTSPSRLLFLPYLIVISCWYAYLALHVSSGNDIMTPGRAVIQIVLVVLAIAGLTLRRREPIASLLPYVPWLAICGSACLVAAVAFIAPDNMSASAAAIVANLTLSGRWGATWIVLGTALFAAAMLPPRRDEMFFVALIITFASLILALGSLRVPYRLGWGDSANRMFTHILPIGLFLLGLRLSRVQDFQASTLVSRDSAIPRPFFLAVGIAFIGSWCVSEYLRPVDVAKYTTYIAPPVFCPSDKDGSYGFDIALRGITDERYAAACQSGPVEVVADIGKSITADSISLVMYAPSEQFTDYSLEVSRTSDTWRRVYDTSQPDAGITAPTQLDPASLRFDMSTAGSFRFVRLQYRASQGQNRLLIRRMQIEATGGVWRVLSFVLSWHPFG